MGEKKKDEKTRADEPLHEENAKPEQLTEFDIKAGLNKYGFIHLPKKAIPSLPFDQGKPLKAKIEGEALVIRRA